MLAQQQIKEQLEDQLEKVKQRLLILDMIEDKLFQMKELAQRVVDKDLSDKEVQDINEKVLSLKEQVILLDSETTKFA